MDTCHPGHLTGRERIGNEMPLSGTTRAGYVARRLHKTVLLKEVPQLLRSDPALALARIALYATAASTSLGPAPDEAMADADNVVVETLDPATGAGVIVWRNHTEGGQEDQFCLEVLMPGVGILAGTETTPGTQSGVDERGITARIELDFVSSDASYWAQLTGTVTAERVSSVEKFSHVHPRVYGTLEVQDSAGNHGRTTIERSGVIISTISTAHNRIVQVRENLAG